MLIVIISSIIWFTLWMLIMAMVEYSLHRYVMHRKRWWLPQWIFYNHAIEHHHNERNDMNIDMPIYHHLILGSPLIIGSAIFAFFFPLWGIPCIISLLATFSFHSYAWTKLHRAIHGLEDNWVSRMWFFAKFKQHHKLHHDRPGRNFAVVYLFTDKIFRTESR